MIFDNITYIELLEDYIKTFMMEYGRQKFEKIHKDVMTSKKISSLIYLSNQKMIIPNKNDFLYSLPTFYIFAKAETLALGGLLGLERWNQECNNHLRLVDNEKLKDIAINILIDCEYVKF